jgi:hypothetical protein
VRHTSTGVASPGPLRFVGRSRKASEDRRKSRASDSRLLDKVTPKPKTEAWYDFWLSEVIFGKTAKKNRPYHQYEPVTFQRSAIGLPQALRDSPLAVFDEDHASQADVSLVHQCLELYISKVQAAPGNPASRQRYIEDKPGSKALFWSMSLSESDRHEVWSNPLFMIPAVYCLVTEKNTEALWHWLELDDHLGPKNPAIYMSSRSSRWKQYVLRDMVAAQTYWNDGPDYTADAMATVLKAWGKRMPIVRPATMFVYKAMKKNPTPSPELYDRFAEIVDISFRRDEQRAFMSATLELQHPTRSDTVKMMQLLRSDPPFVQEWLRPQTYSAGLAVLHVTCHLARKCMAQGRRSDATWVLDHVYDRVPDLLSGGQGLRSFKASVEDADGRSYKYTPSKKELKNGIRFDKDGSALEPHTRERTVP